MEREGVGAERFLVDYPNPILNPSHSHGVRLDRADPNYIKICNASGFCTLLVAK